MSVPPKGVEAWFSRAEGDLLNVENNLASPNVPWETVLFHSHQATEKYLKGVLVKNNAVVPKTHDLVARLRVANQFVAGLKVFEPDCSMVSALYLSSRYPETSDPSEAQARAALALARSIRAVILQSLQP
jgi:HEPN domain-containing protein